MREGKTKKLERGRRKPFKRSSFFLSLSAAKIHFLVHQDFFSAS
jgi:hypothetical protein